MINSLPKLYGRKSIYLEYEKHLTMQDKTRAAEKKKKISAKYKNYLRREELNS